MINEGQQNICAVFRKVRLYKTKVIGMSHHKADARVNR